MPRRSKLSLWSECSDLIRGLRGELASVATFMIAGKRFTRQELIDIFQSLIDAQTKTETTLATWRTAVIQERNVIARVLPIRNDFKQLVESTYGRSSKASRSLGFTAKERAEPSMNTQVAAIEKRNETRAARHTLGKKQKQKIKGTKGNT